MYAITEAHARPARMLQIAPEALNTVREGWSLPPPSK
jgi:hypothetical protein